LKSETQIIQLIIEGNEQGFISLYTLYSSKIYSTALSYTKNIEEAEEVTQDVFVKIFKSISKFKGESSLNTWVYRITINTSLNYLRKRKRLNFFNTPINASDSIDFEHPGVLLENKEHAIILYQVIDGLSDNQKTAFILSYIEDLPRQKVADIMETSLKAVESLLQRAKKNMRPELEKIYPFRRKLKK